ncbi:MAG: BCCT family transporter, partial [Bacteroidota bacterium]
MKLRYPVLLAPLLPLLICLGIALRDPEGLVTQAQVWRTWLLDHFDWLFSWSVALFIPLLLVVYFSRYGRSRIGGEKAKPLLAPFRWFAITVCTTIASGILFWGTAEPLFHLANTPEAGAADPPVFALSTLFLHWTFTPYAMYTVGGLLFAVGFYNRGQPFALSTLVEPLFGDRLRGGGGAAVDAICLFAMVAGMAASLGAGALALAGGLGTDTGPGGMFWVIGGVVLAFVASAISGLKRGIQFLSTVNIIGFILLALFVLNQLPISEVLGLTGSASL